jgi:hypothetical protein
MAFELIEDLPDNVVGIRAVGEVGEDDYEDVLDPAIAAALGRHDKIRLLYVLGSEFTGYEADAMWEDTKLGLKTFTKYDKMAIVTDTSWLRRSVKAFGWLIPGEVKVYPYDQLEQARAWITT